MATITPIAFYSGGTSIPGTTQVGNLNVGDSPQDYGVVGNNNGIVYYATPDQELGYVIAHEDLTGGHNGKPGNVPAYLGFWRSSSLTDESFIELSEYISIQDNDPQTFNSGTEAKNWLNTNGYWTSWEYVYTNTANLYYDAGNPSSYPGSGTTLFNIGTDGPASGTQGTIAGVTYEPSIANGVFNFDGIADDINFDVYNFTDDFTITAWVYPRSEFSINCLISNVGANVNVAGFKVGWNNWNTQNGRMNLEAGNGNAGGTVSTTSQAVTENVWQLLTYRIDRSNQTYTFFVNGVEQANNGITVPTNFATQTLRWYIGAIGGNSYFMNANLGELRVYKNLRSNSQITEEFDATKTRYGL